jgi:acyl-CoA thioesterase-1
LRALPIAVLAIGLAHAQTPATILVVGDSLSAGYGMRSEQSWPSLLALRIAQHRIPWRVVNASISGDTSANGLSRLPAALERNKPELVILALGANDGLRGLPLAALRDNLSAMVELCKRRGIRVLLVGMRLPPNFGPEYTQGFERVYAELARAARVPWVPFLLEGFAADRASFQEDGIHPTAAMQARMLDNVWSKLEPMLRAQARPGRRAPAVAQ